MSKGLTADKSDLTKELTILQVVLFFLWGVLRRIVVGYVLGARKGPPGRVFVICADVFFGIKNYSDEDLPHHLKK